MRRLWLWETAAYRGVTDDEGRAIARASECVGDGGTARVELAFLSASFDALTCEHIRTGVGWTATATATAAAAPAGPRPLRWQPIVPDPRAGTPGTGTESRRRNPARCPGAGARACPRAPAGESSHERKPDPRRLTGAARAANAGHRDHCSPAERGAAGRLFMDMPDGTIVVTAAPQIGRSLHAPATSVGLVVTAYLVTNAVLIPLSGWLTKRYGNRATFLAAITVFTAASAGCAASTSLGMLTAMRVLQGTGGAMMVPVGRTMVVSAADKRDLLKITSYVVWPGLIAPVIAPLAGGLITTYASWHWMFLINVPLGVIALAAGWRLVDNLPGTGGSVPLDWRGMVLTCTGLGFLTYAAHLLSLSEVPAGTAATFGIAALVLLAVAAAHLRRAAHPLLNLRTLREQTFRVTITSGAMYWVVCGAMPFLLPLEFQAQFGWSPVKSGAVTLFIFAGNVGIKPVTTPLIVAFGFRPYLIASTLGTVVVVALLGLVAAGTPLPVIAFLALASGVFRSMGMTAYTTVGFAELPAGEMRDANTLMSATTNLSMGIAVAVATLALRAGSLLPAGRVLGAGGKAAFTVAFWILAVIAVGPAVEAFRMRRDAGDVARRIRAADDGPGTPVPAPGVPAAGTVPADGADTA